MNRFVSIILSVAPLLAAGPSIAAKVPHANLARAPGSGARIVLVRGGMGGNAMGGMGTAPMGGMMTGGMTGGSMMGSSPSTMPGYPSGYPAGISNAPHGSAKQASGKQAHSPGKKAEPCSWWCRLTQ